ncbi:MAG: efflux RND transporter periplasmic adaptor subunit [Myxococcales bacterium]|nr:efflux RND transporter periplasmic adaptor subunit [Myxococcales bacterium]
MTEPQEHSTLSSPSRGPKILQSTLLVGVLLLGWFLRGWWAPATPSHKHKHNHAEHPAKASEKPTVWTCSMHPQIKLPKKGKCPICFMDLIPLQQGDSDSQDPRELKLSKSAMALLDIQTSPVQRRPISLHVRMTGRIAYDETRLKTITAWIPGRLERMFVDYTGVRVRRGDHLVRLYSPELLAAQQELLQALAAQKRTARTKGLLHITAQSSLRSARQKLELMGLRAWQIRQIEQKRTASIYTNLYAPLGGIVIEKRALEGMYVKTGTPLYTIADLSQVWVLFDVYERDLPWVRTGQEVTFTTLAAPGKSYKGRVIYIDPILNPTTRTIRVRANVSNPQGLLKPEMFVDGLLHVALNVHGEARQPEDLGRWICPMHPEITSSRRTNCSICGMALERRRTAPRTHVDHLDPLVIPNESALLTGKRAVVYVRKPGKSSSTFTGREVRLGPSTSEYTVVLEGLREGEEIVRHGAFKLDSELQIQARPSMMNMKPDPKVHKKPKRPKISKALRKQQMLLYKSYFALWRALSGDKPQLAEAALKELHRQAKSPAPLRGKEAARWAAFRARIQDALQGLSKQDIALQRKHFDPLSKAFIQLEEEIGHDGKQFVYLAYCPMAFKDTGASWLQDQEDLLNPYFGAQMLRCGEIKRRFVPQTPIKSRKKRHRRTKGVSPR